MIYITIIAPYAEVKPTIEEILREYSAPEPVSGTVLVKTSTQLEDASISGDVVISRGYTADLLQQYPQLLSVPMQITGYDVIKAVHKACEKYHPQKVALIGTAAMLYSSESLDGVLPVKICPYAAPTIKELPEAFSKAVEDGCDCFVGGLGLIRFLEGKYPAVLVEIGRSAILNSLDEAVRLVRSTRIQVERYERYRTILNYSKDGVISLNDQGRVVSASQSAERALQLRGRSVIGRHYRDALPFGEKPLTEIYAKGYRIENEICNIEGKLFSVDYIPILHQRKTSGAVVLLRSVDRLQSEESLIRKKMPGRLQRAKYHFQDLIYQSKVFASTVEIAKTYAATDSPVLITGESGTGKELMAQSIHNASQRKEGPFVAINCAALTESLLESELFGYSDGAFTGALKGGKEGLFEAAHGGTIFLDEIGEIPVSFQSKLLRVLQEGEVRRIGVNKVVSIDVRVIAATNQDLHAQVRKGLFRRDLLFRLNVLNLYIPPLRERREDIMPLFEAYLREFGERYHKNISLTTAEAKHLLETYPWEGNARELRNIAERLCVLNNQQQIGELLVRQALYEQMPVPAVPEVEIRDWRFEAEDEEQLIQMLLARYNGNKTRVAEYLGIDRTTLWRKIKKYKMNI